jgi:hypothetical protein
MVVRVVQSPVAVATSTLTKLAKWGCLKEVENQLIENVCRRGLDRGCQIDRSTRIHYWRRTVSAPVMGRQTINKSAREIS